MSRKEKQTFHIRYVDSIHLEKDEHTINLPALVAELRTVKEIGKKHLEV